MILLSLTAHESHESVNDFIRSAVAAYTDVRIIIHVNATWHDFDATKLRHINELVFINPVRHHLRSKWVGKTGIHFANVRYADFMQLPYTHVVFHASNELYLKRVDEAWLNTQLFGHASACLLESQSDFALKSHHDRSHLVSKIEAANCTLMNEMREYGWYGGIGDGAFFSYDTMQKMLTMWYAHYTNEFDLIEIDDEIIPLTLSMFVEQKRIDEIGDGLSVCSHQALTTEYIYEFLNMPKDIFYATRLQKALLFRTANHKFAVKGFIRHPGDPVRRYAL
jgi:hypothetical protein